MLTHSQEGQLEQMTEGLVCAAKVGEEEGDLPVFAVQKRQATITTMAAAVILLE